MRSCSRKLYLRGVQDVPVHHLGVNGHERAQIDVQAMWVQAHQREHVKEELGPQRHVLHNEGQCEHLRSLVLDKRLLWVSAHQLCEQTLRSMHKLEKGSVVDFLVKVTAILFIN